MSILSDKGSYGQLKLGNIMSYSFSVWVIFKIVLVCFSKFNSFMHMHMQIMQYVCPIRSSTEEKFAHYIRRAYNRWQSHSSPYSVLTKLFYAIVVSVPTEEHNIHIHTSPLIPQVAPTCLMLRGQHCIHQNNVFTSCGSGHKTFVGLYWTIGTASSKPRLEATWPEFTSPDMRILIFLPWRRCVVAKSKLQKVNTESKFLLACHLSRLL
jgi:hypothetical protein